MPFTIAVMESLLLAAMIAAAPPLAPPAADPALDRRCFALMAAFAEDEDPRLRAAGRIGAGWFLGRIDAADQSFDAAAAPAPAEAERPALAQRCGEAMGAAGRDFRSIGESLRPPGPTA